MGSPRPVTGAGCLAVSWRARSRPPYPVALARFVEHGNPGIRGELLARLACPAPTGIEVLPELEGDQDHPAGADHPRVHVCVVAERQGVRDHLGLAFVIKTVRAFPTALHLLPASARRS